MQEAQDLLAQQVIEDAIWWVENRARFWRCQYGLGQYVRQEGLIRLPDGRVVEMVPDSSKGVTYDVDKLQELVPALVNKMAITIGGDKEKLEAGLTMLSQWCPDLQILDTKHEVDKLGAKHALEGGGEVAEKVKECVIKPRKLGVRK